MKKYQVTIEGSQINETAINILTLLRDESFMYSNLSLLDFITEAKHNIWKLHGIGIYINEELTLEEQYESLVEQLIKHKLLPLS